MRKADTQYAFICYRLALNKDVIYNSCIQPYYEVASNLLTPLKSTVLILVVRLQDLFLHLQNNVLEWKIL